jgi:hypothetical protein
MKTTICFEVSKILPPSPPAYSQARVNGRNDARTRRVKV